MKTTPFHCTYLPPFFFLLFFLSLAKNTANRNQRAADYWWVTSLVFLQLHCKMCKIKKFSSRKRPCPRMVVFDRWTEFSGKGAFVGFVTVPIDDSVGYLRFVFPKKIFRWSELNERFHRRSDELQWFSGEGSGAPMNSSSMCIWCDARAELHGQVEQRLSHRLFVAVRSFFSGYLLDLRFICAARERTKICSIRVEFLVVKCSRRRKLLAWGTVQLTQTTFE